MLTVGSLFSGIGGFDLGFERAGMRTLWFCEQDPFCQRVLAKHWPGVPCHPDVAQLRGSVGQEPARLQVQGADVSVSVPYVDVLCGGFPCQDISLAGRGAGLAGERSGLWREFARLIGELRPRYVVIENVPALTSRGLDVVLADLAACGFDAEWDHLPASALGAPHRRDRIWLIAYPGGDELREQPGRCGGQGGPGQALAGVDGETRAVADPERGGSQGGESARSQAGMRRRFADASPALGDPEVEPVRAGLREAGPRGVGWGRLGDAGWWLAEPDVRRVADGPAQGLDGGLNGRQGNGAVASPSEGAEGLLRDVWEHVAARAASSRRGSDEQLARELADALSELPHGVALGERERALAASRSYVCGLRTALSSLGALSDASQPLAPAWLALPAEDQGWIDVAVGGGQWSAEWPGVGRVAHGVPKRVDRLRALGNALVPQIAEWIGRRILEWERA